MIHKLEGTVIILAVLLACVGVLSGARMRFTMLLTCVVILFVLTGCAALPMPLQPRNAQYNSDAAEVPFLALEAIDTAQTMHIRRGTSCDHEADSFAAFLYGSKYPRPGRVLATNLVMLTAHTMVTSWLDDKVAEHAADNTEGLWYSSRVAWHVVSLATAGAAVVNNHSRGCPL